LTWHPQIASDHAALVVKVQVQRWASAVRPRKAWDPDPDAVERWVHDNSDTPRRLEGASVQELKAVAIELQKATQKPGLRKTRHSRRLSIKTRLLLRRAYNAPDAAGRKVLLALARASKRRDLERCKLAHLCELLGRGKVLSRSTALHHIDAVLSADGHKAANDAESACIVALHYRNKWCTLDQTVLSSVRDFRESRVPGAVSIASAEDLCVAFRQLRKHRKFGLDGVCTASLGVLFHNFQEPFIQVLNAFLGDVQQIGAEEVHGFAKGKDSKNPQPSKVRVILPQNAVLSICDAVLANKIHSYTDILVPPCDEVFVGARPGTQCADIAFACQLVVEKALDDNSRGALSQSDIGQFYDNLPVLTIAQWLAERGAPDQLLHAVVQIQLCPRVFVRVGEASAEIGVRAKGGLTGSRLAGALARIPAELSASNALPEIQRHGYKIGQDRIGIALWVDNCFSFGNCLGGAIEIQEAFEKSLADGWGLSVKEGSRSCLVASGSQEETPDESRWPQFAHYDVLGHTISNTGAIRASWLKCRAKMWASFYANFGGSAIKKASVTHKMKCIERAVRPVMSYRSSIWAPQKQVASELDAMHRKMISVACPTRRAAGEDSDQYARRKGRYASSLAKDTGLWSKHWFDRALAWDEHVHRNRSGCKWNRSLLAFHDASWLQQQRSAFAANASTRLRPWTIFSGRTCTRASAGKVQPRWQEAVQKVRSGTL